MPRSILRCINKKSRRLSRRSAPTANQAAGGARDWNATRRGAMAPKATPKECSMRWNPTGTGNGGASEITDVEARKIEAQIAQ